MIKKKYTYRGIVKSDTLDVLATIKNEINWIQKLRKRFSYKSYMKEKPDFQSVSEALRKNIIALNKVVKQLEINQKKH